MSVSSITLAHHLWMSCLQIARERECAAEGARRLTTERAAQGVEVVEALQEEMYAAMVAVSAAAHAIDGLYGEIRQFIPLPQGLQEAWTKQRTSRPDRIFETLKIGCKLGPRTHRWPPEFKALYKLRDPAVHHVVKHQATVPHPSRVGVDVSYEMGAYSLEAATRSLDLALDVAVTVIRNAKTPNLASWASTMAHVPAALQEGRSRPCDELVR